MPWTKRSTQANPAHEQLAKGGNLLCSFQSTRTGVIAMHQQRPGCSYPRFRSTRTPGNPSIDSVQPHQRSGCGREGNRRRLRLWPRHQQPAAVGTSATHGSGTLGTRMLPGSCRPDSLPWHCGATLEGRISCKGSTVLMTHGVTTVETRVVCLLW